jgi:hypothetical protein
MLAVYSEKHVKHINTQRGQSVELLNVEASGLYSALNC